MNFQKKIAEYVFYNVLIIHTNFSKIHAKHLFEYKIDLNFFLSNPDIRYIWNFIEFSAYTCCKDTKTIF